MKYYTYAYLRKDDTPYYIGKGTRYRAWNRNPQDRVKAPKDKSRILILKRFENEDDAFKHERYMIAVLGRKIDGGILINISEGGEGVSAPKTEEHKQKISASNTGVLRSAETKARMSIAKSGVAKTSTHKKNISASLKGKPWSAKRRKAYEDKKKSLSK